MNRRDDQPEKQPVTPATGDTVPEQRAAGTTAPSGRVPGPRPADAMLASGPPPAPPAPGAPGRPSDASATDRPGTGAPDGYGAASAADGSAGYGAATGAGRPGTGTDPDRYGAASATDRPGTGGRDGYGAASASGTDRHGAAADPDRYGPVSAGGAAAAAGTPRGGRAADPRTTGHGTERAAGHTPAAPVAATPLAESPLSAPPPGDPGATGRSGGHTPATPAAPRGQEPAVTTGGAERADLAARAGHAEHAGTQHGTRHTTLLADGERDRLDERLHHALAHFVDEPRGSVEEADAVLDEAGKQLVASLEERRRTLRAGWQRDPEAADRADDTEELRQTLRHYREVTQRLLGA
ncbi:hypothetical protein AB0957_29410 [Streptomyces zhihengii]|uniref:hypothetical protein n=1 Tax=Streptomyces zhihengii TaxID=1818004 RepID=UPI0034533EEA